MNQRIPNRTEKKRKVAALKSRRFVVAASWAVFLVLVGLMNHSGTFTKSATPAKPDNSPVVEQPKAPVAAVKAKVESREEDDDDDDDEHEDRRASVRTNPPTTTTFAAKPTYTRKAPVTQTRSNGS